MTKHTILVVGASGKSGTPVVNQALAAGHDVTAFVRRQERAAHLPPRAHIFEGDGLDAAAVNHAIPGHDVVVVTVGYPTKPVSAPVCRNVVAAMTAAGAKRLVLLSGYGPGETGHGLHGFVIHHLMPKLNADKLEAEAVLEASDLDWVAVRAPMLDNAPSRGGVGSGFDVRVNGFRSISRADLATFLLAQVESDEFVHRKPIVWRN